MEESSTYRAILEEGEAQGFLKGRLLAMREILLKQGTRRFGPPDAQTLGTVETLTSPEVLDALLDRIADVESWGELLTARRGA